ncbi:MAG: hypothetical protein K2Y37_16980 [Pirellulales bacterium]|nr:hypothetical protein [Pirellulales bacterium]
MQPNKNFVGLPKSFWANIRTISQEVGYTVRPRRQKGVKGQAGPIKVPTLAEIKAALESIDLTAMHLVAQDGHATDLGRQVIDYFEYRADALNRIVEPLLMDASKAEQLYAKLQRKLKSSATVPMNKQSEEKKKPAYFTGIINMLIDANLGGLPCNYNPQELTTVTRNREPFRTLARRIDGAFPGPVDPLAVWEIKEYYYTTTFGSRVADGVYETLLDGMELEELDAALRDLVTLEDRPVHIQHLLMVDAHFTWWVKGRSYLCRIIDMLHMGYVDEVLFGDEVLTRMPKIARAWGQSYRGRSKENRR